MRLDKWLWAARLFKTRSLAAEAADRQRIFVNELAAKPAKELRVGDRVALHQGDWQARTVIVRGLAGTRGPAAVAQTLFEETAQSIADRERAKETRRLAPEPAAALRDGRPSKRDRRRLESAVGWRRWSASLDEH